MQTESDGHLPFLDTDNMEDLVTPCFILYIGSRPTSNFIWILYSTTLRPISVLYYPSRHTELQPSATGRYFQDKWNSSAVNLNRTTAMADGSLLISVHLKRNVDLEMIRHW